MMTPRTVAIMQPTYLPWIGYFDLIDQVDCFVFLDSVQFERRSWQQRNRVKAPDRTLWLSVPVLSKGKRGQVIKDVRLELSDFFVNKHLSTIEHLYAKSEFYDRYMPELSTVMLKPRESLAELDIDLINWFCEQMEIDTPIVSSSDLEVSGKRVELLVDICRAVGAKRYVSPQGSKSYIDENNLFESNGIDLAYHEFRHPEYRQLYDSFVPYLSALDLLFNEGPDSLSIVRKGRA
jgi:hypothetical protein